MYLPIRLHGSVTADHALATASSTLLDTLHFSLRELKQLSKETNQTFRTEKIMSTIIRSALIAAALLTSVSTAMAASRHHHSVPNHQWTQYDDYSASRT